MTYTVLDLTAAEAVVHPPVTADSVMDAIATVDDSLHSAVMFNSKVHRDDRAGGVTLFTYNLSPMVVVWTYPA